MTITQMARSLGELMDRKAALEADVKETGKQIQELKDQMSGMFIDEDVDSITVDGYKYRLEMKSIYSKRSDEAIAEAGLDYFDVLREYGLGDIIVETVNSRTLQSAVKAYLEQTLDKELSGDLAKVISTYEQVDVKRTKERKTK